MICRGLQQRAMPPGLRKERASLHVKARRHVQSVSCVTKRRSHLAASSRRRTPAGTLRQRPSHLSKRARSWSVPAPILADSSRSPAGLEGLAQAVVAGIEAVDRPPLRPVINATGVVLHTNLGRAPLSDATRAAMDAAGRSFSQPRVRPRRRPPRLPLRPPRRTRPSGNRGPRRASL